MSETPALDAVGAKLGLLLSVRSRTVTNRIARPFAMRRCASVPPCC